MSFSETVVLGALAGFTIYVGLPVRPAAAAFRSDARRTGDVLGRRAGVPLRGRVRARVRDRRGRGRRASRTASGSFGNAARSRARCWAPALRSARAGLAVVERWMRPERPRPAPDRGRRRRDAMTVEQASALAPRPRYTAPRALRTGHDDRGRDRAAQLRRGPGDRGIGSTGEIGLATVLIIGFALHNATEGFGIVGPLGQRTALVELARGSPAWSAAARRSSGRWSATTSPPSRSSSPSTPSRAARSST